MTRETRRRKRHSLWAIPNDAACSGERKKLGGERERASARARDGERARSARERTRRREGGRERDALKNTCHRYLPPFVRISGMASRSL